MSKMQFLRQNFVNTTSVLAVDSNTGSVSNMLDRNLDTAWESSGYGSTTVTTIVFTPASPQVINRIALTGHNFKAFTIFYDQTTTNTLSLTSADTATSTWATNSQTAHFLEFDNKTITSLHIRITSAQTADTEKSIQELYVGSKYFTFANNPPHDNYSPEPQEKIFTHEMSDGGSVKYWLADTFKATIDMPFVSTAERVNFKSVYTANKSAPVVFVPYPTTTSWDQELYEVNWVNGFDFYKLEGNTKATSGFRGKINLAETARL